MTSVTPPPACPAHGGTPPPMQLTEAVGADDPRAVYRGLRAEWGNVARVELEPGVPAWLVMGYNELLTITRQEQLYSRDVRNWRDLNDGVVSPDSDLMPMMGYHPGAYHADGLEHRRLRRPFDEGLARIDQRKARRLVEKRCTELVAKFSGAGRADLVSEYAAMVPMMSISALFGMDSAQSEDLVRAVFGVAGSGPGAEAAYRRIEEIMGELVRRPEGDPAEDLTWTFAHHPNLRTDEERFYVMHLVLIAGNLPAISWISQTLKLMLADPRFAARVRGGRLGVDDALEEALWREPPMNNLAARYALHDTELGGRLIRRGDCLILGIAAANDDPAIHAHSAQGDELWGNRAHLAFSTGPHVCPAQVPARLIVRTAVSTVLNLLPDARLSIPVEELRVSPSPWTRIPEALPVEFSAARIPVAGDPAR